MDNSRIAGLSMSGPRTTDIFISRLRSMFGTETRLAVPTITSKTDFANLVAIRNGIPRGARIILDFSACGRLSLNAILFLGGLVALVRTEGGSIRMLETTLKPKMKEILATNGMLAHLGSRSAGATTGELPFERYDSSDESKVIDYLERRWLGSGAVQLSPNLQNAIVGNVWEVYANVFEHSESPIGVVHSGSLDRRGHKLLLSVMDLGIGIPESVQRFWPHRTIHPGSALRWAFTDGTSTKAEAVGYSRGLGLHTLKEFIRVNRGYLEVFSNYGYAKITTERETYRRSQFNFPGTLMHINLSADERFYCFAEELPKFRSVLGQ